MPAIPFLGVYLTDLTFLDLGNSDFLPDTNFINFDKRRKAFNLIKEIQKYQLTQYSLQPVLQIQEFMKKLGETNQTEGTTLMTEDQLYEKSMEVEAKEDSSDDDDSD